MHIPHCESEIAMDTVVRPTPTEPVPVTRTRSADRAVLVAMATGLAAAVVLTMAVLPGATEGVTTGAALLGFGLGWGVLHVLTARSAQPLQWAAVPAVAMSSTGAVLIVTAPSDRVLSALAWGWPPVVLVLATWTWGQARRSLGRRGRLPVVTAMLVLALTATGAAAYRLTSDSFASVHPAPGTRYEVGDHALHLECRGQGQPTVVLVSGLGEFSASWARIQDGLAPVTRVCAYDRAGQGWSDDVAEPQDGITAADDLHALLGAAGVRGPFVLAGHSIGGPYAMTYAARYADDVAGLVLLDSTSPHQLTEIPGFRLQHELMRRVYGVLPSLARVGLGHLLGGSHLPAPAAAVVDAMSASPRAASNARDEVDVLPDVLRQAQALTTLGDRPLVVLTSAENADATDGWAEAQQRMAGLSTDALQRDVPTSHTGLVEDEDGAAASVQAIASVVGAIRTGAPLATP
ncbi:pimeloyl-ACP methyl ester carboxylesterase [Nocardioides sp. BE266]|uniref:alpha/beta fold hydrolase n=1 Tax=Nocardioides sp. BE266 TaxID=2817725 RepID=UPI0028608F90|nr:alpha/beta fold hydrolase [Nocardioides sp. BE266]MDR7255158.1 pimeloyl-ACP methyl ester carboxylesterase [Nocardioides sp. BE266]